ncbi:hypothetical protein R69619_00886 [Paraburkholderia nemoris]|uniref:rolling circle replication-associated protein n=1 Tax=Paraburkholderia nemoris TaxID=2793076 RepID=UPI00190A6BC9|nr:hypothetical protein [Paraburkholderia nemoris]MBK3739150.1 hypothetical protein [Paraburkholderia aspalathi]CAE6706728.1 hypothetical protein R69619_00886 [Paraburkholderia nemoris]
MTTYRLHSTNYPKYRAAYENLAARLREQRIQAKDALVEWVRDRMLNRRMAHDGRYCAVTLTCKQARKNAAGGLEVLTRDTLSATIGKFLTLLSKDALGKAYRRHHRQLKVVTAIETGAGGRLHAHLLLEVPRRFDGEPQTFFDSVEKLWTSLQWARPRIDVKQCTDVGGWASYISKEMLKNPDAIDFLNLHL